MTTTPTSHATITALAKDLKPLVHDIEASAVEDMKNHYGRYMNVLGLLGGANFATNKIIALALIQAGANRAGVAFALKIYGG